MIDATILHRLGETLAARKGADPSSSYVAGLMAKGETIDGLYRRMVDENMVRKDISWPRWRGWR